MSAPIAPTLAEVTTGLRAMFIVCRRCDRMEPIEPMNLGFSKGFGTRVDALRFGCKEWSVDGAGRRRRCGGKGQVVIVETADNETGVRLLWPSAFPPAGTARQ